MRVLYIVEVTIPHLHLMHDPSARIDCVRREIQYAVQSANQDTYVFNPKRGVRFLRSQPERDSRWR